MTRGAKVALGVGGVGLIGWLLSRSSSGSALISKGVSIVELATVKSLLPKGAENIAELAFELAPRFGVSPYTILAITYAESNFGLALTPVGPNGTGDFIPRPATPALDKFMATNPLPEAIRKQVPSIPARNILTPTMAWVPTTRGWGHGLYQLDWTSHIDFLKTGRWSDPRAAMEYALQLFANNTRTIAAAMPTVTGVPLVKASIAAYNAGATRVIQALKAGKSLDTVTFTPNYVTKISLKADSLIALARKASGLSGLAL